MTIEERTETIEALTLLAEEFVNTTNKLRALTVRNAMRNFYEHLVNDVMVPDGEGGMRALDPATDRDVVIPGARFTLGEVLDMNFMLNALTAFLEDDAGGEHTAPGVMRRLYGFTTPAGAVQ